MKTGTIIAGVLLFAVATAIIYVWGLRRQMNKTQDLMNLLFSNGVARVNKYLKNNDYITMKEAEDLVDGMSARLPFSADKSVVTDPKDFAEKLLSYMEKTGQLKLENNKYYKNK